MARRRPPELDDPAWLRDRYQVDGDIAIARELGVDRNTVRAARARFGIASRPPGRRSAQPSATAQPTGLGRLAARITDESGPAGPAPTFDLLAQRVRNVHAARVAGDRRGLEEALLGLGAAAGLVLDNLDRLAEISMQRREQALSHVAV